MAPVVANWGCRRSSISRLSRSYAFPRLWCESGDTMSVSSIHAPNTLWLGSERAICAVWGRRWCWSFKNFCMAF
uniref:Uncharacterized protein n=1 Tax=Hyaloperonospora arabidopsidis (strain Emoy2) TaxID=559515 RepID=M4BVM7_HYAAE